MACTEMEVAVNVDSLFIKTEKTRGGNGKFLKDRVQWSERFTDNKGCGVEGEV